MIELVYLNENISKVDADLLVKQGREKRQELFDQLLLSAETIKDGKRRAEFVSSCLPIIAMI
jgi:hypothetical protein